MNYYLKNIVNTYKYIKLGQLPKFYTIVIINRAAKVPLKPLKCKKGTFIPLKVIFKGI